MQQEWWLYERLLEALMAFLGYNKDEKLEFNYKRACGLWLIVVATVIAIATMTGGKQIINMQVFSIGYVVSIFSINMNRRCWIDYPMALRANFKRKYLHVPLFYCLSWWFCWAAHSSQLKIGDWFGWERWWQPRCISSHTILCMESQWYIWVLSVPSTCLQDTFLSTFR